jgi:predicted kinase
VHRRTAAKTDRGEFDIARTSLATRLSPWPTVSASPSGAVPGSIGDAGYRAAHAIAEDNLRLGRVVLGDCVNPWMLTRNAWRDVGTRAGVRVLEIETICSNLEEHRRRVETRAIEIPGISLPTWAEVIERDYHSWDRDHLIIDTADLHLDVCVERVLAAL